MSWQNDLENIVFTIVTGDGREYRPKWKNATKDVEYNSAIFEFVNVEGSLVLRKKQKGRRFDLEFYFDGENAVTLGNNFEISARNEKYWTVKHPFYGNFKCQPLTLKQDNTYYNVSKFNVQVIETITDAYPQLAKIVEDEIVSQVEKVNKLQAQALENSKELDKVEAAQTVSKLNTIFSKIIKTDEELKEFQGIINDAVNEITNVAATGMTVLTEIQRIINYPATISQTLQARYNSLKEAFTTITDSFTSNKNMYEGIAGGIVCSMCWASITDIDYGSRKNVIKQQESLLYYYNRYMQFLDGLQTERADSDESYTPDFNSINELSDLVKLTISNLFEITFGLKQEREYTLEKDSNVILLTHRFYGLDKDDQNISNFIRINNIGLKELINIPKGRKIIYYV